MALGITCPDLVMKNVIPVIMAGVLGIYGLIVSIIIAGKVRRGAEERAKRARRRWRE
jgi:V-type H+-transporting ATPase proteolipid subunit